MATEDLIRGLQSALGSYAQAKERADSRQENRRLADLEYRSKGLLPQYDGDKIVGLVKDPEFEKQELDRYKRETMTKAALEGREAQFDDSGLLAKAPRIPEEIEYLKAKSEADPFKQMIKGFQAKKLQKEVEDPTFGMSEPEKKVALDSAAKLSDTLSIKDSMDGIIANLRDANISPEQKVAAARSAIKLINSATLNSPDAVSTEEAERAASFITPSVKNWLPGNPGPGPMAKPDVGAFAKQLELMSKNLGSKAGGLQKRSGISETSGLLKKAAPTESEATTLSPEDQAALAWAKDNPGDKRSQKILDKLGVK